MLARKKPVVVEVIRWDGTNVTKCVQFIGESFDGQTGQQLSIKTLEGTMTASLQDYIIKGVNGECYPCKPDIFKKTYDIIEENEIKEIIGTTKKV